jgi:vancomycin resistance protein YoaR
VIINGELQTGLGGGVCQVSTTVFNAAFEAGLPITSRTNHALYISHYPTGRDATVNYPDLDLKFVNDTGKWLLLRTFVGSSSLTVALYGTPVHRRVESETAPLRVTAEPSVKRVPDPERLVGETSLSDYGEPARATSVRRRVYSASGKLLSDDSWSSYYLAEPRVVLYGTKPKPKPPKPPKPPPPPPPDEEPPPPPTTTGPQPPPKPPPPPPAGGPA